MSSPEIEMKPEELTNRPTLADQDELSEWYQTVIDQDTELGFDDEDLVDSLFMAIEENRAWTQKQATNFDELLERFPKA